MALETVTHISDLVVTNPASTDPASQGDDHLRNIKKALKNSFPNITGPVTATQAQLNTAASGWAGLVQRMTDLEAKPLTPGSGITTTGSLKGGATVAVDGTVVRTARNMATGDGLSGGGDLTADRSISVDSTVARRNADNALTGTQSITGLVYVKAKSEAHNPAIYLTDFAGRNVALFFTTPSNGTTRLRACAPDGSTKDITLNAVTGELSADSFSGSGTALTGLNATELTSGEVSDARIPTTVVRTSRSITAGDGLSGGGDLTTSRALAVDGTVVRTTRTIATGDGLSGGGTLAANRTLAVDGTVVRTDRAVWGGNGLTGGGDLTANRTLTLGTPSAITATSTNSVTATSHTHSLSASAVRELIAQSPVGEIGTYAILRQATGATNKGTTKAGSALTYAACGGRDEHNGTFTASSPAGTWRAMGIASSIDGNGDGPDNTTLWLRIS